MKLSIKDALIRGVEQHKSGNIGEADRIYTAILELDPNHPDANHNMGVIAVSIGKVLESLFFFKTALKANPTIPQFWSSYVDALLKLKRVKEARTVLDQCKNTITGETEFLAALEKKLLAKSNFQDPPKEKLDDIIALYNKNSLQEALNLSELLLKEFTNSPLLFNLMGVICLELNKLDAATQELEKALRISPHFTSAHYNLGIVQYCGDKFHAAIKSYKNAISLEPDHYEAYNNMGNALKALGNLQEAINAYNKAIAIKPEYYEAYNNLGNSLKDFGKLGQAIDSYNQALAINPNYAEAHSNLSVLHTERSSFDEGKRSAEKAIMLNPDLAEAHNSLGNSLEGKGEFAKAINSYSKAIRIKSNYKEAFLNIGTTLEKVKFLSEFPPITDILIRILEEETYASPRDIADVIVSILKFDPIIKATIRNYSISATSFETSKTLADLGQIPLLLNLMKVCPIPDLELETLFTNLRLKILSLRTKIGDSIEVTSFLKALGLQCFTNEYLYNENKQETKQVEILENSVAKTLKSGNQPKIVDILCLASYRHLHTYDWCQDLKLPNEFDEIYKRLIFNSSYEQKITSRIATITQIENSVSKEVAAQYEQNPYPRWTNIKLRLEPVSISRIISELGIKLSNPAIKEVRKPDILIAGCGTGHHSIGTAARFMHSKIKAIDLSLASLAYAKRKSKELGFDDIEYVKGDILDLGKLNEKFDIIECLGVLHHMDDPMAGWKILASCLKPKGLMKIGLYSELARKEIMKFREKFIDRKMELSEILIKEIRNELIKNHSNQYNSIVASPDFYSLSGVRDLLFHVKEQQFTIPKIERSLSKLGLKFCGFENSEAVNKFKSNSTTKNDLCNLDKWANFEEKNPQIFGGMYQFWCQSLV